MQAGAKLFFLCTYDETVVIMGNLRGLQSAYMVQVDIYISVIISFCGAFLAPKTTNLVKLMCCYKCLLHPYITHAK